VVQVGVGAVLDPEWVPWKPNVVLAPGATTPFQAAFAAVTPAPCCVTVAFQAFVTRWSPAYVHATRQPRVAEAPVFVTVTVATKPESQALSTR
jgi:hypothetical protein